VKIPYTIWQPRPEDFMAARYVESATTVPRNKVWEGEAEISELRAYGNPGEYARDILEDLFTEFNLDHPGGFEGHSLSVGDIVTVGESSWLCAPIGWAPCSAPVSCVEEAS
jgi:hypothetical protein